MSDRLLTWSGLKRFSAVYLLVLVAIIFTLIEPTTFPTLATVKSILNENSIDALVALGVTVPLAAGLFDLSVGSVVGLSGMSAAWILGHTGLSAPLVIAIVVIGGAIVGLINAFVVVGLGVDSFIGTLATGSIIAAATIGLSGNNILSTGVIGPFSRDVATANWGGFTVTVFIALGVVVVLWLVLERTTSGRHFYAVGFAEEVASTLGLAVRKLKTSALIVSAILASIAGIALVGSVGGADPTTGPSYLLPAFAMAFLGATQVRRGRFNAWGTGLAVLLLGCGDVGILLSGAPTWTPDVFEGVVLIIAVWMSERGRRIS